MNPSTSRNWFGQRRLLRLLSVGLLFFALWLVLRSCTTFHLVFPGEGRTVLAGPDGYHHLRHVQAVLEDFPRLLRYDPMSTFPQVERGLNQGFYDLAVASAVKLSGGLLQPAPLMAWISAVLAGLSALLVAGALVWAGRRLWAGMFLVLMLFYPGALRYMAVLGEGDHHAAEVLLAALLGLALHRALRVGAGPASAIGLALVMYLFAGTWAGAPMLMFLVVLAFYAAAWLTLEPADRRALVRQGAVFAGSLAALIGLTWTVWPDGIIWTVGVGGMLLSSLGALLLYGPLVWAVGRVQEWVPDGRRQALLAVAFGVLCLGALQLHPTGRLAFDGLFSVRPSDISEHPEISLRLVWGWYGPCFFLFPIGCALAVKEFGLRRALAGLTVGAGLVFFWLRTHDFIYYAPLPIALASGYLLARLPEYRRWAVLALCALPLIPALGVASPWLRPAEAVRMFYATEGIHQASDWLKAVKGELVPQGAVDPYPYGVVGPWDLGNLLAALSQTPVVMSQTHSEELARLHFSSTTEGAYQQLQAGEKPVRFVLIPARSLSETLLTELGNAGLPLSAFVTRQQEVVYEGRTIRALKTTPLLQQTLIGSLYLDEFRGADRFRLVFESPRRALRAVRIETEPRLATGLISFPVSEREVEGLAPLLSSTERAAQTSRGILVGCSLHPEVKVFEAVPGVQLVGVGPAKSPVRVVLGLHIAGEERQRVLSWNTETDADGRFQLRLPYSTEGPPYATPFTAYADTPYLVRIGSGTTAELVLTEAQVQEGVTLEVDFRSENVGGDISI